jgi:ornithine cyclodeaminase/alanine dehydrogenase-like protein (mu-crystallin family)
MDPQLVKRGRLFVDSRAAAVVEAGDIVMNIAAGLFNASHVRGEIGELWPAQAASRSPCCGSGRT